MQLYLPPIQETALADGLSKSEQFTDAELRVVAEAKFSIDGAGSYRLDQRVGKVVRGSPLIHNNLSLGMQFDLSVNRGRRVVPNPDVEDARIQDEGSAGRVPVSKFRFAESETDGLGFSRLEHKLAKAFELAHGARRSTSALMDVELSDRLGGYRACVCDIREHFDPFVRSERVLANADVRAIEFGIAKAIAEGIKRRAGFIPITFGAVFGVLRGVVRVVDGHLADVARPSKRQFT